MKDNITFIDHFAGIGGMRLGFESIGAKCVFTSEWDEYAQKTYRANFPDGEIAGDITRVNHEDIPDHDVLLAGFPCQPMVTRSVTTTGRPFSLAGVSKKNSPGRAHGFLDLTQGTLFFDIARIIDAKRPRAFLLETVRNLVAHDKGKTFRVIRDTLEDLGYYIHHRIIDGRYFVPQHRERIFIAGFRDPVDLTGFLRRRHDRGSAKTSRLSRCPISTCCRTSSGIISRPMPKSTRPKAIKGNCFGCSVFGPDDTGRTLSARYYKDGSEILISRGEGNNPRRLTPPV